MPTYVARLLSWTCLAVAALCVLRPAAAQVGSERYASIVVDAASGSILSSANPDEYRYPASLTKMMTLYMLFEAVRDRRVGLQQYVPVSAVASSMSPTKLGLVPGSLITVEQAVLGLVTRSANDAACALGELLGGDEDRFAQMMTVRAHALGMTHTQFRNASGLPDWNQVSTARDMAILARRLIQDFPAFYHYFSTPSFVYAGRFVPNHQRLLQTYPGADGLKTGYTEASGYNVVTSAVRGETRLIGVVLGAASGGERDLHMAALLDQGYERLGVAPALVARREPGRFEGRAEGGRGLGLIGVAQAAPAAAHGPARQRRAPVTAAAPVRRGARAENRIYESRAVERVRVRPAAVLAPLPGRPTRTAHQVPGWRYPG